MKNEYYFFPSELKKPRCNKCGSVKKISDWNAGNQYSKINGEIYWYKTFDCDCQSIKETLAGCYTSDKKKLDKMIQRKVNGYKINFTNMEILKNTIKIIVILLAIFIIINVFWWLFGGMISKIPQLVITQKVEVPVEIIKEVPTEVIKECDVSCAIEILSKSESNHWISYAIDNGWSCEKKALKEINCGNLPYPDPKKACEEAFR